MKVKSIIKRDPPTKITLGNTTYQFQPDSQGRHVCEVTDQQHLARLLSIPEGYCLAIDGEEPAPVAQAAPVIATEQPTLQPVSAEPGSEILLGSSVHPAIIDLGDGRTVQLGTVVQQAFDASGMTVEQWNEQDEDDRYAAIDAVLDAMVAPADEEERDPADTNGDGEVDASEERAALVKQYQERFGKKPHHKAGIEKIRAELAAGAE